MFALTDLAVETNNAEDLSGAALGVAVEACGTDAAAAGANLERPGNGSGGKESGDGEKLHLEKIFG